jgi:hypothetical protein
VAGATVPVRPKKAKPPELAVFDFSVLMLKKFSGKPPALAFWLF